MGTCLQEWFLDPLFASAEEVQDSADRLESNFRTWLQEAQGICRVQQDSETQRLRLMSSCDTLRWQLEVFERAVKTDKATSGDPAIDAAVKTRRQDFVNIIRQQLLAIENHVRRSPAARPKAATSQGTAAEATTPMPSASSTSSSTGTAAGTGASTGRIAAAAPACHVQSFQGPAALREAKHQSFQQQVEARLSSFVAQDSVADRLSGKDAAASRGAAASGSSSQLACSLPDEVPSPAARSELSGFFGASWTSSPRSVEGFSSIPNSGVLCVPEPGLTPGRDADVDARLIQVMDDSPTAGQGPSCDRGCDCGECEECDGSGQESAPGRGTFPSLVSHGYAEGAGSRGHAGSGLAGIPGHGGLGGGVQGWQCLMVWVQHLQRATRRRRLTGAPSNAAGVGGAAGEGGGVYGSRKAKDEGPGRAHAVMKGASSASTMRSESPMAHAEIRTSSSVCGIATEHTKASHGDWHFDVPAATSPSEQECGMRKGLQGQGQAWGATAGARHRRNAIHPRPGRPYSSLGLVLSVAMLMLVLACYCTLSGPGGLDRRSASLMETSSLQASSPSFN